MSNWTPADRRLNAQRAALIRWSREKDPSAATEPGRRAAHNRFEKQARAEMRQASPDVAPDERQVAINADRLRRAFYKEFARKGIAARRKR